jgi:hypothetical protein
MEEIRLILMHSKMTMTMTIITRMTIDELNRGNE